MGTKTSKNYFPVLEIAKTNIRHNASFSIALSIAILFITPVIFGTANLDAAESAVPLEMFVSFVGIVLLTPIFYPEQNEEISDLVSSKYVSMGVIYFIRSVCALLFLFVMIGVFVVFMYLRKCDTTILLFLGTAADAVFLGSLGMITAALADHTVIAYMTPLVFYVLNYSAGSKLGNYYLFSMCTLDFKPKLWMMVTGLLLIFLSLIIKRLKKKIA